MDSGRKKYMMGGVALALAGVLSVTMIATHLTGVKVEAAKNTLSGITKIVSENSATKPFNILEIVPEATVTISGMDTDTGTLTLPTGTVGWLLEGNEPINIDHTLQLFKSSGARKDFMSKLGEALKDVITDDVRPEVKPLYMVSYDEVIEDLADEDDIIAGRRFMPEGAQSVNNVKMNPVSDRSGGYLKIYINPSASGSENSAAEDFFNKKDETVFVSSNGAGDFDPNFMMYTGLDPDQGLGMYCVSFKKGGAEGTSSYSIVEESKTVRAIEVGASWNQVEKRGGLDTENTPLYRLNDDGTFEFAGYLVKSADDKIAIEPAPNADPYTRTASSTKFFAMRYHASANPGAAIEGPVPGTRGTTNSGNMTIEPGQTAPPATTSENSNAGGTVSGGNSDGGSISGGSISGNPPGGIVNPGTQDPGKLKAVSGNYYALTFEYVENGAGQYNVDSYSRVSENRMDIAAACYTIPESNPLIPNYTHTGTVNNKSDSDDCICFERTYAGGNYAAAPGGTETIYVKGAYFYYVGGFWNNEWFKRYVLDRTTDAEFSKFKTKVHTISAASVTASDLEKADLIYISAKTTHLLPNYPGMKIADYSAKKTDLSQSAARTLLYLATMRNKPVMADYQILNDKNNPDKSTYAYIVTKVLTADDLKQGYNYFVSNYNADGIVANKFKSDMDKAYVHDNVYIFNDFSDMNAGHTILNGNFRTSDDTNNPQKKEGLEEVYDEIIEENKKREAAKRLETIVHEGTCIRYILNRSISDPLATKGNIRILEIEPTAMDLSGYDGRAKALTDFDKNKRGIQLGVDEEDIWVELKYDLSVTEKGSGDQKTSTLVYTKYDMAPKTDGGAVEGKDLLTTTGNITIDQMSVREFIGRIDDLNSEYDMIFIGDDTSGMNHTTERGKDENGNYNSWKVSGKTYTDTEYNDATMDGLIYSNVGDYFYFTDNVKGSLASEYSGGNMTHKRRNLRSGTKGQDSESSPDTTLARSRYPGNDIRKADIKRLYDYAKADFPIVVADNLLVSENKVENTKRKINQKYVDNCSNLYQLMKKIIADEGTSDNFFRIHDILNDKKNTFKESLCSLKPEIYLIRQDYVPFPDADGMMGLTKDSTGKYKINIKFRIDDSGSGGGTEYTGHFYTDMNADGKYSSLEELSGNAVRFYDGGGGAVPSDALHVGSEYNVIVELNDSAAGVYPWKLSVVQKENDHRRDCVIGYGKITDKGEKETIKVLQINTNGTSNLNMQDRMDKYKGGTKTALGYYLSNINDFELDLTTVKSDELFKDETKIKPSSGTIPSADDYRDYFRNYDMLIVGFADTYKWGNLDDRAKNAAEGLLEYIAEGNSVLFTHDTTSYWNTDEGWGYVFNQYLRSVVGMNRYGSWTEADNSTNPAVISLIAGQKEHYDSIFLPRSNPSGEEGGGISLKNTQSQGITEACVLAQGSYLRHLTEDKWTIDPEDFRGDKVEDGRRIHYDNHYFTRLATALMDNDDGNIEKIDINGTKYAQMVYVECSNRGQITQYPYVLPDVMPVKLTHGQYWQLNLDIDDDNDNETDVVVWYTLGKRPLVNGKHKEIQYKLNGKDARCNYFIYNRGNVTYSGQGHKSMEDSGYDTYKSDPSDAANANECMLLVNTIIASYSAGARGSKVHFHETGDISSKRINSDVIPYDVELKMTGGVSSNEYVLPGAKTNTKGKTVMTSYFELADTNVVYSKKVYAKFYLDRDTSSKQSENPETDTDLSNLEVISVKALTDDGEGAAGYRAIQPDKLTNEYLLYDQDTDIVQNTGKMFQVEYVIDGLKADPDNPVGVSNTPGIQVDTRTVMKIKRNGIEVTKTATDNLTLLRAKLFDLK